jgi:hypothetical protein
MNEDTFIPILETDAITDIALIKSVLDSEHIDYFFQGENMKFIDSFQGPARLMVNQRDVKKTIELLKSLNLNYVRIKS